MIDQRSLPEGVYDKDGQLWRDVPRFKGFEVGADGHEYELHDMIPRRVVLPVATDNESVEEGRLRAARAGHDFLHPRWGWLRAGRKREQESPENLGNGVVRYRRERRPRTQAPEPEVEEVAAVVPVVVEAVPIPRPRRRPAGALPVDLIEEGDINGE